MSIRSALQAAGVAAAAIIAQMAASTAARAECTITWSACYPWRIEAGQNETTLLEIIPNNAITAATYRVCVCPPSKNVSLMFDFKERVVQLGSVASSASQPTCRDYRIQTARSSRLFMKRGEGSGTEVIEGCYVTF